MNGKGSQLRKGANLNLFWQNYDNVFRKKNKINEDIIKEEIDKEDGLSYSEKMKFMKKCCNNDCNCVDDGVKYHE